MFTILVLQQLDVGVNWLSYLLFVSWNHPGSYAAYFEQWKETCQNFSNKYLKFREYKWLLVRSSNPKYIELLLRFHQKICLSKLKTSIKIYNFYGTSKWKVCIMHVHVWCDFMHFFDTLYQFQLYIWKCWSISA